MRQIILASTSDRRKELLTFLGVPFDVVASGFPEEDVDRSDFENPSEYVATLAAGKALAVAPQFEDAIIIGSDTIVYLDGVYYGKPKDLDDARAILEALRGKQHKVLTAVYIMDTLTGERQIQIVETLVAFSSFSDDALERYIDTSESMGKAGAYAIQSGAKSFVSSIDGSLSNVVGLPLREVTDMLERFDIPIDADVDSLIEEQFTYKS